MMAETGKRAGPRPLSLVLIRLPPSAPCSPRSAFFARPSCPRAAFDFGGGIPILTHSFFARAGREGPGGARERAPR